MYVLIFFLGIMHQLIFALKQHILRGARVNKITVLRIMLT